VKLFCALCGRVTLSPAVMIGNEPIGPKCAKKAGLLPLAKRKGSRVKALAPVKIERTNQLNLELFECLVGVTP
jgi:hypothetical protein